MPITTAQSHVLNIKTMQSETTLRGGETTFYIHEAKTINWYFYVTKSFKIMNRCSSLEQIKPPNRLTYLT